MDVQSESLVKSGRPSVGSSVTALFNCSKAWFCSGSQVRESFPGSVVAAYRGVLAICENPDIQIWQNPMAPKDSLTCLLVVGWFIWLITCFCLMPKAHFPFFIINLRYFTSVWQIWAFFHDTLYPAWSSKPRKVLVPAQHRKQISAIKSRSSAYCRIWHLVVSGGKEEICCQGFPKYHRGIF